MAWEDKPNQTNQKRSTRTNQQSIGMRSREVIDCQEDNAQQDNKNARQADKYAFHNNRLFLFIFAITIAQS